MKTVLITGANRGIGLEHARAFTARGVHVLATAREPAEAQDLQQLKTSHPHLVTLLPYDAAKPEAPAQLKAAVGNTPIDLLLANAGAMGGAQQSFGSVDVDDTLQLLRINSLAPLKVVEALVDNIATSGKKLVAMQSSQMGSIADNSSGGYYAYRLSKVALNMVAKQLSNDLRARKVTVVALHPGWVKTRMGGQGAPLSAQQSVAGQQQLFERLGLADSGRFFNFDGRELPW